MTDKTPPKAVEKSAREKELDAREKAIAAREAALEPAEEADLTPSPTQAENDAAKKALGVYKNRAVAAD